MASKKPLWVTPHSELIGKARLLIVNDWNWTTLNRALKPDEVLISVDSNGLWKRVALLETEKALTEIYSEYRTGHLISLNFFALPNAILSQPGVEVS